MSLLAKIKADSLQARKDRDSRKSATLTTLYSEAVSVGKNDGNRETTDAETIAVVKKFVKNIDEVLKLAASDDLVAEREVLQDYLPRQMSQEELQAALKEIVVSAPDIKLGPLMNALKAAYGGQYDGAMASKLAKEMLGA